MTDKYNSYLEKIQDGNKIRPEDLSWVVADFLCLHQDKVDFLASKARHQDELGRRAFQETLVENLRPAAENFFFRQQHWKSGRNFIPYAQTVINRVADHLVREQDTPARLYTPHCPWHANLGQKSLLVAEEKLWRCELCTIACSEKTKANDLVGARAFALHSRSGYRCPHCSRFLPTSLQDSSGFVSCPYPFCTFIGEISDLTSMKHPVTVRRRNLISLNESPPLFNDSKVSLQDCLPGSSTDPLWEMEMKEKNNENLLRLKKAIQNISKGLERQNSRILWKKLLMCQAFRESLEEKPEELGSFLLYGSKGKINNEYSANAHVFQKYISLVEKEMSQGKLSSYQDILDPELGLFLGESKFTGVVKGGKIANATTETYTGQRLYKNHGPCFIGKLISLLDTEGKSLLDQVASYTFSEIFVPSLPEDLPVQVTHYRITPHYEMGSLVILQKIRKKIQEKSL